VISDVLKENGIAPPESKRTLSSEDQAAVDCVANEIARRVDDILKKG
jgi:hypothetical protein